MSDCSHIASTLLDWLLVMFVHIYSFISGLSPVGLIVGDLQYY